MNIRHRVSDIKDLQVFILQDYFRLGIKYAFPSDDWKQTFFGMVQAEIINKKYAARYIGAWKKLQYLGLDKYDVTEMDTTIIVAIHRYGSPFMFLANVNPILINLTDDRNETGHTDAHETISDLLGWSYCALKNLERLLMEVRNSDTICSGVLFNEADRTDFVKNYQSQIQEHFNGLENDYKEEVAEDVMINQDINILKSSKGGFFSWGKVYNKYLMSPVDFQLVFKFLRRAADEEIAESFSSLANMYYDETDCNEKMGLPVDYEEVAKLLLRDRKISGRENDIRTDIILASIYINGLSQSHDADEGNNLLEKCKDRCEKSGRSTILPYVKKSGLTFYRVVAVKK